MKPDTLVAQYGSGMWVAVTELRIKSAGRTKVRNSCCFCRLLTTINDNVSNYRPIKSNFRSVMNIGLRKICKEIVVAKFKVMNFD